MKRRCITFAMAALAVSAWAVNISSLANNQWTELLNATQSPNYGNWTYENDVNADPLNGVMWLGPGHRGSPQDNIFYAFTPETESWSTLHTALPPAKACLRHFSFSTQDSAIVLMGGSAGHQNSTGIFDSTYMKIVDKAYVGYGVYYHALNKNKWYNMRGPGLSGALGAYLDRVRYDPVHDIFVYHQTSTMIYSLHNNEWRGIPGAGGPGVREKYAAGVDEKRGLFYLLGGTNQSYCTNAVDEMWSFNPETESWTKLTGFSVNPWEYTPACVDYNTSMAYSARSDAFLFVSRPGTVYAFDCQAKDWSRLDTAGSPLQCAGHIAYEARNNLFYLLGGSAAPQGLADQRTTQGLWVYKYVNANNAAWEAKLAAPDAWLNLTASGVTVQWTAGAGFQFNIYRANARPYPKGFVKLNGSPLQATSYTDNTASAGTAYSYRVVAVDGGGKEGLYSRHLYTDPARPLGLAASVETPTQVKLTWEANTDPGIVGYHVYRGRGAQIYASTFQYQKLTTTPVTGTQFTDSLDLSDNVARGYVITAVNIQGIESGRSPAATTFPTPPLNFRAFKKQGATIYSKWVGQAYEGPTSVDSTVLLWQAPERVKITGVNFYRGDTRGVVNPPTMNPSLVTDTATVWFTKGTYGAGTFTARAVNILGQEGYISDVLNPDNHQFTNGTHPYTAFAPRGLPPLGVPLSAESAARMAGTSIEVFPNPVRSVTVVQVGSPTGAPVRIYDCRGKWIASLNTPDPGTAGRYTWKTKGLPAGVYFARVSLEGRTVSRKFTKI